MKIPFFLTALRKLGVGEENRTSYSIEDSIYLTISSLNCFLQKNCLKGEENLLLLGLTARTMSVKLPCCLPASRTQQ